MSDYMSPQSAEDPQQRKISPRVRWAREKRAWLILALGSRCVDCGTTEDLSFDCIKPMGGEHHKLSSVNRMTFYTRQAKAGNLTLRCCRCNSKKSNKTLPRYMPVQTSAKKQQDFALWCLTWAEASRAEVQAGRVHVW